MFATVSTEKMLAGGDCLARLGGKRVLVRGALPGETVRAEITADKGDFFTARAAEIEKPSPHRVEPRCPFYGECGGCNLQIADSEYQRELKRGIMEDSLRRAGFPPEETPKIETVSASDWGYRNRFQLHGGGLKARGSARVVPVTDCAVAVEEIRAFLQSEKPKSGARVHVFAAQGRLVRAEGGKAPRGKFAGSVIDEGQVCTVELLGRKISFDVHGFFQSNLEMLGKTAELVRRNIGGKRCADIYSGVGTFSVLLADKFEELYLVEHNRDALVLAERNLARLAEGGIACRHFSYGISGAKWREMPDAGKNFDAVVVDPPRAGMEKAVREWLKGKKAPQIRALSCDAVTFARDAADLRRAGYALESLTLLDYYPQTSHIESLANFAWNG